MRISRHTILMVAAGAAGMLLTGADRVPVVPAMLAVRDAVPIFEGMRLSPEATGEIVPPRFPAWLRPVQLPQTPGVGANREPVKLSVAAGDGAGLAETPGSNGSPVGTMGAPRRLAFTVAPRIWAPTVDASRAYLVWQDFQADGARARIASDPTTSWSALEALRARVPVRDFVAPSFQSKVPVPVEPGSRIQSIPPAPDEPPPARPLEVIESRPRLR